MERIIRVEKRILLVSDELKLGVGKFNLDPNTAGASRGESEGSYRSKLDSPSLNRYAQICKLHQAGMNDARNHVDRVIHTSITMALSYKERKNVPTEPAGVFDSLETTESLVWLEETTRKAAEKQLWQERRRFSLSKILTTQHEDVSFRIVDQNWPKNKRHQTYAANHW